MQILIAPSILSADPRRLNEEIAAVDSFSDLIHVDIMDGKFVPNTTFGPSTVAAIKSQHPLDCHLMVEDPENHIEDFAKAIEKSQGEEKLAQCSLTIHQEACPDLKSAIRKIKKNGIRASVAIRPKTDISAIESVLKDVDMVLLMTVEPGFGGQEFMPEALPRIRELRKLMPNLDIEVDGGINDKTAKEAVLAGANILVAGAYIFSAKDRKKAIENLRV